MKYSAKHVEDLKVLLQSGGQDAEDLYQAVKERDAKIAELEAAGKVLVAANTKHFDSARANYEALQDCQKRLEAAELELKGARDTADFYRADAYNSDVEGMKREDRLKAMQRYMPTEETRSKLMTICQDQGELTMGQRVDEVVQAYESLRDELARQRRTETELRAEIRTLRDREQELEKQAGNYRVKIGRMEDQDPSLKVHEDLVPDWVKEKIKPTRWEVIAYPEKYRTTFGLRYHLVHCMDSEEFNEARDLAWERVIGAAFYWADHARETRGDEDAAKLRLQVDRLVEDGVKAAEARINEVYAQQQELVQDAFRRGKQVATEQCARYAEATADNISGPSCPSAPKALTLLARDLRRGDHDSISTSTEERPTEPGTPVKATVSFKGTPLEGFFGTKPIGAVAALKRVSAVFSELQEAADTVTKAVEKVWLPDCDCGMMGSCCKAAGQWVEKK